MDIEKCLVIRCQIPSNTVSEPVRMQHACRADCAGDWLSGGMQVIHKVTPRDEAHHMNL